MTENELAEIEARATIDAPMRESMLKMGESGDLNEGFIVTLSDDCLALVAEVRRLRARQ